MQPGRTKNDVVPTHLIDEVNKAHTIQTQDQAFQLLVFAREEVAEMQEAYDSVSARLQEKLAFLNKVERYISGLGVVPCKYEC